MCPTISVSRKHPIIVQGFDLERYGNCRQLARTARVGGHGPEAQPEDFHFQRSHKIVWLSTTLSLPVGYRVCSFLKSWGLYTPFGILNAKSYWTKMLT